MTMKNELFNADGIIPAEETIDLNHGGEMDAKDWLPAGAAIMWAEGYDDGWVPRVPVERTNWSVDNERTILDLQFAEVH